VTGSYDKQLITWNIERSEPETIVQGQRVQDLAVSTDGTRLVIITPDRKVKMFALPGMSPLPEAVPLQVARQALPPLPACWQQPACSLACPHGRHRTLLAGGAHVGGG
jgi:hypothetical protein